MDSLHYAVALVGCLTLTAPLEFALGARVYRRPRVLLATLLPVAGVFVLWDVVATARGHWWFDAGHTLPVRVLGLPVEEWLFFIVVPVCAVLTYEALGHRTLGRRSAPTAGTRSRPLKEAADDGR